MVFMSSSQFHAQTIIEVFMWWLNTGRDSFDMTKSENSNFHKINCGDRKQSVKEFIEWNISPMLDACVCVWYIQNNTKPNIRFSLSTAKPIWKRRRTSISHWTKLTFACFSIRPALVGLHSVETHAQIIITFCTPIQTNFAYRISTRVTEKCTKLLSHQISMVFKPLQHFDGNFKP